MKDEVTSICSGCGASVYRQHIDSGIARYEGGKLLCSHCVVDYEKSHNGEVDDAFEPIEIEEEDESRAARREELSSSRIHGATKQTLGVGHGWDESRFQRQLGPGASGATRCRTFHCKLSEAAIEFMTGQINEWLDANDKIVVKFATTTIGPFEGKHTEPNLIITAFY